MTKPPPAQPPPPAEPGREPSGRDRLLEQMEAIFHSSFDGIWICDGQGWILRINRASERINNLSAQDWVGRHISELASEGVIDQSVTLEVLKKRRPVTIFQKAERTGRKLLVTGTPIFRSDGEIDLVLTNDRDITELDNLRLKLMESQARTERFQHELLKREVATGAGEDFIGRSAVMRQILATAIHVAGFKTAVLISGASGTGKSLLARLIHRYSDRQAKPFVRVECGAIPASLFESEVFGYEKGAFTGASNKGKLGLFEMAEGGTLFLDEVAQAPFELQHKLLRFLEAGEIVRVGATEPVKIDARVIAASNTDLADLVAAGKFRNDLYYRLQVVPLSLPPLKDREEDLPFLIRHFLDKLNQRFQTDKVISGPAMEALISHDWPGNVREVENLVERLVVMSPGRTIDLADLPESIMDKNRLAPSLIEGQGLKEAVRDFEARLIDLAVKKYGSQAEAAKALKVSQATITRKRR